MTYEGVLTKMQTEFLNPIQYYLVFENSYLSLNQLLGKSMEINFHGLEPMECRIKIIHDKNRNGIRDNGDLEAKIFPERVYYYQELLTLKAYWDLEQSINIDSLINNTN